VNLAVLGSGPGGYVAAIRAAQLGGRVTVVEDTEVGGTCLNRGCIPTKTIVSSCELLARAREMEAYGISLSGSVSPNLSKILERKNKVVSTQVRGIRELFRGWDITLIEGRGLLASAGEVTVARRDGGTEKVPADRIIIATGSRPAQIAAFPFDGRHILSSTDVLELAEIPRSMLIIGAGIIGSEFACIFRELGTEVTMVEMLGRAVASEDEEVSQLLEREFRKKKIKLLLNTGVSAVKVLDDGVHATLSDGKEFVAEKVLVSIGRALNSDGIGLEAAGVLRGKKGEIAVNDRMETNVKGIYAVGDVTGGILLAHMASAEGMVAAANAMGADASIDYAVVPAAVFTSPEIASVGLREQQARQQGLSYRVGRFQYRALGRAHAMGEITGFVKIIADASDDRVLGCHIMGAHASDLIHEAALAMRTGRTVREIAGTIHAHPTLAEAIREAAEDVLGEAIHVPRR